MTWSVFFLERMIYLTPGNDAVPQDLSSIFRTHHDPYYIHEILKYYMHPLLTKKRIYHSHESFSFCTLMLHDVTCNLTFSGDPRSKILKIPMFLIFLLLSYKMLDRSHASWWRHSIHKINTIYSLVNTIYVLFKICVITIFSRDWTKSLYFLWKLGCSLDVTHLLLKWK